MSNIRPMTKIKKFNNIKDEVVQQLFDMRSGISNGGSYTYTSIRPHKHSHIYIGCNNGIEGMTFALELEYKGVLLMFFYEPIVNDNVEYNFAFDWTEDEIESGTGEVMIPTYIDEAGLFQESLINDIQFLTIEIHQALVQYCNDVQSALRNKIEYIECD